MAMRLGVGCFSFGVISLRYVMTSELSTSFIVMDTKLFTLNCLHWYLEIVRENRLIQIC